MSRRSLDRSAFARVVEKVVSRTQAFGYLRPAQAARGKATMVPPSRSIRRFAPAVVVPLHQLTLLGMEENCPLLPVTTAAEPVCP